ncbi:SymE family type I addiction module toxin [Sphingobacterium spiritivorum]|uniref:SymE family type I addiction module toxin n=1 Tax=Sphingobacterium spiritivorum TaxID=258 RepID=UPI003DA4F340|nr:type I addiction module toxin, SymE family [Elizabethkingia anophelis]
MNTKKIPLKQVDSKDKLLETRRITVCRKVLEKRNSFGSYNPVITLTGKWLWESGFKGGDKLALKVYEKKIVIEIEMSGEEFYKDMYDDFE